MSEYGSEYTEIWGRADLDKWCKPTTAVVAHTVYIVYLYTSVLGVFEKLRKATIGVVMSLCLPARGNSALTERIFMKFDILVLHENLSRNWSFIQISKE